MENNKQLVIKEESLLLDVDKFEHAQRVAVMLAKSTMVPEHFRNNIGNCVIALNYSARVGIDPFMAMQKMYVIHGKPAIEAQLQIAIFNNSPRFSALKFKTTGTGVDMSCYAYATEKETDEVVKGIPVSISMAKKEGWYDKKGSKWQTLPELMLQYRAASFFIRVNAPESTLGLHTPEELKELDLVDVTPKQNIEQEIENNANQDIIDIPSEETVPDLKTDGDIVDAELSEDDKKEILAQEKADAIKNKGSKTDPGF